LKAIGINARTLELLEPAGVTERLLDAGLKISRITFQNPGRVLFTVLQVVPDNAEHSNTMF